jgi:hypothetical protein
LLVNAQDIGGVVVDKTTRKPIPFVNIGVVKKQVGTVSDQNGRFTLDIPEIMKNDTLKFSCVGYNSYSTTPAKLIGNDNTQLVIELAERTTVLKEVVVSTKKAKTKVFGIERSSSLSHTSFHGFQGGAVEDILGSEIGMVIKPKRSSWINDFNFYISENEFDSLKLRVNIYRLNGEEIGENILKENIIVDVVGKKKGWIRVDLKPYNIIVEEDFVISFECIGYNLKSGNNLILIPTFFPSFNKSFQKYTSQDAWLRGSYGVSINVTLVY